MREWIIPYFNELKEENRVIEKEKNDGERYTLLRQIAEKSYRIPYSEKTKVSIRSLERYLHAYESGGFDALKSKSSFGQLQ